MGEHGFFEMSPATASAVQVAWQSSALLAAGLIAARLGRPRPSRSHRILVAAAVACLVVPPAHLLAGRLDLGLFAGPTATTVEAATTNGPPAPAERSQIDRNADASSAALASGPDTAPTAVPVMMPMAARPPVVVASGTPAVEAEAARPEEEGRRPAIGTVLLGAWAVVSAIGLARLLVAFGSVAGLVRRSSPVEDRPLRRATEAAACRLGIAASPDLRSSTEVRCPAVWCWGRRPVLLIPEEAAGRPSADWSAVLCHELAHWKRRDHLAGLLGELLVILLPWQPLARLARRRMDELGELACDDWALDRVGSVSPADYAETLLGMAAQGRSTLMPAAVSRTSGLVVRVRHILEQPRPRPLAGRAWSAALLAATVAVIALLALAQSRSSRAIAAPADDEPAGSTTQEEASMTTIKGIVRGPDGSPIAGAALRWVGPEIRALSHVARPESDPESTTHRIRTFARGETAADGRFRLSAEVDAPEVNEPWTTLYTHAPGLALGGTQVALNGEPLDVTLEPPVTIVGRLLTPGGEPAEGVEIRVDHSTNGRTRDPRTGRVVWIDQQATWDERPPFLPGPIATDADGRFAIEGLIPADMFTNLVLSHPDFAVEEIVVSTGESTEPTPEQAGFSIRPVPREFTHTLIPARPVVGRVTDAESGEPLAGVTVKVTPMRKHGGMPIPVVTDADGRYRVSDREGQMYFVTAYPAAESGYRSDGKHIDRWPDGAAELTVDLALRRGPILRGRVVDAGTGEPIAGAAVVYQARRGNPHVQGREDFRSPTLADSDGRFAITGIPGPGVLVAEGPSEDFIRDKVDPMDFGHRTGMYVHGLSRIEVPEEGEFPETVIRLRKGVTLEARCVDADGSPVEYVRAWCPELTARLLNNWFTPTDLDGGRFRLPGAEPGRTYRVFFLAADRELGAVAELVADPSGGPIEVRLQPTATVSGTVVDADGMPIEGAQILNNIQLVDKGPTLAEQDRFDSFTMSVYVMFTNEPLKQVYPAEFRYDRLIPGVRYFVTWNEPGGGLLWHAVEPLEPGEVRDLGSIVATPKEDADDN